MNSYEIIKRHFTAGTKPGTFGRMMAIVRSGNLLDELAGNLVDKDVAMASMRDDGEVRISKESRVEIDSFHRSGMIS